MIDIFTRNSGCF